MKSDKLPSILYVDDEQENLDSFQLVFMCDYEIHLASSAKEGLEILKKKAQNQEPIQLVISDHKMPETTGIEFLKQLNKEFPGLAKILLTGFSDAKVMKEASEQRVLCLSKPWIEDELKQNIESVLV